MYIKSVTIKNFRKIIDQKIDLSNFNVFVGLNDSGKSTILKALNLFFNGETEAGQKFNFDEDFSRNATIIAKKAREIIIELELISPSSYEPHTNISWLKVWRKGSSEVYKNEIKYIDDKPIPPRKKINAWLNKIKYRYVPAVKSQDFFSELLGDLHDVLARAIEADLKKASDDFSTEIKKSTDGITKEILDKLDLWSILDLPPNLKNIFRSLEFKTGPDNILLSRRGDGIKTRHIPAILKFIADQENLINDRGSPVVNTIWGYEEPENSLEMLAAFDSAKNFYEYSEKIQMLITTHSPAFYSLELLEIHDPKPKIDKNVKIQFVKADKDKGVVLSNKKETLLDFDDELGLLPFLEPRIKATVNERDNLKKELSSLKRDIIVVEGKADKLIFQKAIELFSPDLNDLMDTGKLAIENSSAGANGVADKLIAMCHSDLFRCFGIFDTDEAGKNGKYKVSQIKKCNEQNGKRIRFIDLKLNPELGEIRKKFPTFGFELEDLYSTEVWKYAARKKFLEERNVNYNRSIPQNETCIDFVNRMFQNVHTRTLVLNQIKDNNKESVAKWIIQRPNASKFLINFKSTVDEIQNFFIKKSSAAEAVESLPTPVVPEP